MTDLRGITQLHVLDLVEAALGKGCGDRGAWMRIMPRCYPVPPSWVLACCSPTEPRPGVEVERDKSVPRVNHEIVTMRGVGRVPIPGKDRTAAVYAGLCGRCGCVRWTVVE